jgi:hypothetical protein
LFLAAPKGLTTPPRRCSTMRFLFQCQWHRPHHKDIGGENASKHGPSSASRDI